MNEIKKNTPNTITCLNILFGTVAIVFASRGAEMSFGVPSYMLAWLFIALAAVADFCDGLMSRLLKAYSLMGKELDSLCDCVSFGVAPAILLAGAVRSAEAPEWLCWVPLLIPVAGALRLAKFNVDTRQTTSFRGLPIPANAIFWIGYTSLIYSGVYSAASVWAILVSVIVMSGLMVSELRLMSLKFKTWGWKGNEHRWLLVAGVVAIVALCGVAGLMWAIIYYILLSLVFKKRL